MPDDFKSLKEVFLTDPALRKIRSIVNENDVINDFLIIFPEFKKIAKPERVNKSILTLKVENAAWRTELKFKEKEIVKKINNFYGEERISSIKFSAK